MEIPPFFDNTLLNFRHVESINPLSSVVNPASPHPAVFTQCIFTPGESVCVCGSRERAL